MHQKKAIAFLLSVVLAFSVLVVPSQAADRYPESEHNYANNSFDVWEYTSPVAADSLTVVFSADTYVEPANDLIVIPAEDVQTVEDALETPVKSGDYIALYDGFDTLVGIYDGDALAGQSVDVAGDSFRIVLSSDAEGTAYGFAVTAINPTVFGLSNRVVFHSSLEGVDDFSKNYKLAAAAYAPTAYSVGPEQKLPANLSLTGWATEENGPAVYAPGAEIPADQLGLELWAVWTKLGLGADEIFSFNNYRGYFQSDARGDRYYISKEDYRTLQLSIFETFGITVIPPVVLSLIVVDYTRKEWTGSCYGLALVAALQHLGLIDMLKMQNVAAVPELTPDDDLISLINFYHTQQASSWVSENKAIAVGSPMYKTQLKDMCGELAQGNLVLFSFFPGSMLTTSGHTVLLTGLYDDADGNHVAVAYDPNKPWRYAAGAQRTEFVIAPDYSSIAAGYDLGFEWQEIDDIKWTDDYEQFKSFTLETDADKSDPNAWYATFFRHIEDVFRKLFRAIRLLFGA